MVFVQPALVQDGLSSRYHMSIINMNHFRHTLRQLCSSLICDLMRADMRYSYPPS
jgi:hypothetical protein